MLSASDSRILSAFFRQVMSWPDASVASAVCPVCGTHLSWRPLTKRNWRQRLPSRLFPILPSNTSLAIAHMHGHALVMVSLVGKCSRVYTVDTSSPVRPRRGLFSPVVYVCISFTHWMRAY